MVLSTKPNLHHQDSTTFLARHGISPKEQRMIVESLISIIPPQKDSVTCSFLLRLLRLANVLKVAPALITELEKRVGMQFEQATLQDLLLIKGETAYDVDLVQRLLEHFLVQEQTEGSSPSRMSPSRGVPRGNSISGNNGNNSQNAKMRVARLVDSYLTEVARDRNLPLTKFQVLAEALPESARTCDDGLYRAIDSYLKVTCIYNKPAAVLVCSVKLKSIGVIWFLVSLKSHRTKPNMVRLLFWFSKILRNLNLITFLFQLYFGLNSLKV